MDKELTNRKLMHHNYNGGWHGEGDTNKAFHHGMDVGFDIGLAAAANFLRERIAFDETHWPEVGPFTREEMGWWLESAKTGKYPNGDEI